MDEVDFTILAAKSVLSDMIDKCPPAETCRDAFDRTAKATIKMASSTGGFGVPQNQQNRRPPRREPSVWNTATPDSSKGSAQTRHRHQNSDNASYQFDMSVSADSLSSPTLSVAGEAGTTAQPSPSMQRAADGFMMKPRSRGGPSPSDMGMKQEGSPVDSSVVPSPPVPRRVTSQPSTAGSTYASQGPQQYGAQARVDFPDSQAMEFLQNLNASNGEYGGMDQSQVDLNFMNWEGLHHDFAEGPQMNPFDNFFFGGQQGGTGGNEGGGAGNSGGMGM